MAERKVLIKYFPPNFDPDRLVKRGRGKDRLMNVRNMLPMSLRCNTCSNYLYIGTKFNMRMQICNDEMYLGIKIFRFYLKCTYCYAEITFKTDPKNHDYVVETGGTRNYDPHRDALQAEKLLRKLKTTEEESNTMKSLENKTYDSKRQMELLEVLDEIKHENKRHATLNAEQLLKNMFEQELKRQMFSIQEEEQIEEEYEQKKKALEENSVPETVDTREFKAPAPIPASIQSRLKALAIDQDEDESKKKSRIKVKHKIKKPQAAGEKAAEPIEAGAGKASV